MGRLCGIERKNMLSWQEIVEKYIITHSDLITKVTKPLRDHFGVCYFTYHHIDNKGRYTVLVDRPDWAQHYVAEKIFLNDPYLRHPDVYQPGFCLLETHGSEEYKQTVLKSGKTVLNMDTGVMLIQKTGAGVEFFGFAANKKTSSLDKLYTNRPYLLKSFGSHFKKELSSILFQMKQESSSLLDLKGNDFLCKETISPEISQESHLAYLKEIGMRREIEMALLLSMRERQCLKLLLEGKSAKETAVILRLSPRTVESYFENIKDKLSCWTKHEIYSIAQNFQKLGLL